MLTLDDGTQLTIPRRSVAWGNQRRLDRQGELRGASGEKVVTSLEVQHRSRLLKKAHLLRWSARAALRRTDEAVVKNNLTETFRKRHKEP